MINFQGVKTCNLDKYQQCKKVAKLCRGEKLCEHGVGKLQRTKAEREQLAAKKPSWTTNQAQAEAFEAFKIVVKEHEGKRVSLDFFMRLTGHTKKTCYGFHLHVLCWSI